MFRIFGVTFETRKPFAAAFEFDGDNVKIAFVMNTPRLLVNDRAFYVCFVNRHKFERECSLKSRFCLFYYLFGNVTARDRFVSDHTELTIEKRTVRTF